MSSEAIHHKAFKLFCNAVREDNDAECAKVFAADMKADHKFPTQGDGLAGGLTVFKAAREALDCTWTPKFSIIDGDRSAHRFVSSGIQKSEFIGIPSKGNKFDVDGIVLLKVKGDKVVEAEVHLDNAIFHKQLIA